VAKLRTERAVSAGGVVWRPGDSDIEVLLCGRHVDNLWALPKGTPEPGETIQQSALREVREETGVIAEIEARIGDIRYWFSRPQEGVRYFKVVHHFLMRPIGGDPALHDHEFDEVRWIPVNEALKVMSYANEARIVRQAVDLIRERGGARQEAADPGQAAL
jgi:8-oxo-dGTP pyrophosphatase MutT (NUDIX family)